MAGILRSELLSVGGMNCASCKSRIEKRLSGMDGVSAAEVDYVLGTAKVVFDEGRVDLVKISDAIEALGYRAYRPGEKRKNEDERSERDNFVGLLLLIGALYLFLSSGNGSGMLGDIFNAFPQAEAGMGYGALFVVGLLTSVHCVAMCGGINLSQALSAAGEPDKSAPKAGGDKFSGLVSLSSLKPVILYNSGRVASYSLIGAIVGALGSFVSFSGAAKGIVQVIAGLFMVVLGINMLGMFKFLRAFVPGMPKFLTARLDRSKKGRGPLYVGLLNGLMPCGPLQAMQFYALSTGSPVKGALAMLVFSLGTVPLMFGLGAFGSLMSRKFAGNVMKVGAALVIVMGVVMFNNGTTLSGFGGGGAGAPSAAAAPGASGEIPVVSGGFQEITTNLPRRGYPTITVKVGVPVRWNLYAEKGTVNGCNNAIVIPAFNIEKRLATGDNIIEFTPTKAGKYRYSCWMGMIRGTINVEGGDL